MVKEMSQPLVTVVMGSDSDLGTLKETLEILKNFHVPHEVRVISAHRWPEEVVKFAKKIENRGIKVIIAAAGGAAHLPGVIASYTTIPVIGIPMETETLKGLDSLLSIVQMPSGVPVATMAIGKAGAKNAALFAIEILGLSDRKIDQNLLKYKDRLACKVREKDKGVQKYFKKWLKQKS